MRWNERRISHVPHMKESCSTYRWVKWHTNESLRDMTHSYAGHDFFIARRDSHTPGEPQSKLALLTCPNDLRARLCVYVCVRERETERACVCTDDMLKWFEGSSVCVCVCVCVCVWQRKGDYVCTVDMSRWFEGSRVCVYVCMCECEALWHIAKHCNPRHHTWDK